MSNELFKQFLDQLPDDDLRRIVLSRNIGIEGFRVTPEGVLNIPRGILKKGIEIYIKKTNVKSLFKTQEDYKRLLKENKIAFYFRILYDLYKNINIEVISSLLSGSLDKNENISNEQECIDTNIIKDKEENIELKIENTKLVKNIKLLEKQLRQKQEDFVKQQNLNQKEIREFRKNLGMIFQKEKNKIEVENKHLKEKIQSLNNNLSELKNRNTEKEDEIQYLKGKLIYYTSIMKLKNILLFQLCPLDNEFPYSYKCIKTLKDFREVLLNEKISDFWYLSNSLNPFEINKYYKFMKDENISINIQELKLQDLKALKLGENL